MWQVDLNEYRRCVGSHVLATQREGFTHARITATVASSTIGDTPQRWCTPPVMPLRNGRSTHTISHTHVHASSRVVFVSSVVRTYLLLSLLFLRQR